MDNICKFCSYEWNYKGSYAKGELITCPKCYHKIKNGSSKENNFLDSLIITECRNCYKKFEYKGRKKEKSLIFCPFCNTKIAIGGNRINNYHKIVIDKLTEKIKRLKKDGRVD